MQCSHCGKSLDELIELEKEDYKKENYSFCPYCGNSIINNDSTHNKPSPTQNRSETVGVFIGIVVIAMIAIFGIYFLFTNGSFSPIVFPVIFLIFFSLLAFPLAYAFRPMFYSRDTPFNQDQNNSYPGFRGWWWARMPFIMFIPFIFMIFFCMICCMFFMFFVMGPNVHGSEMMHRFMWFW